jgi:micrococcal nuclease
MLYFYEAKILRVIDGDTVEIMLDLGFKVFRKETIRLAHIDTPELPTPEGTAAKLWLIDRLSKQEIWFIDSLKHQKEKYGRYLGIIYAGVYDDISINQEMIEAHLAKRWPE